MYTFKEFLLLLEKMFEVLWCDSSSFNFLHLPLSSDHLQAVQEKNRGNNLVAFNSDRFWTRTWHNNGEGKAYTASWPAKKR